MAVRRGDWREERQVKASKAGREGAWGGEGRVRAGGLILYIMVACGLYYGCRQESLLRGLLTAGVHTGETFPCNLASSVTM